MWDKVKEVASEVYKSKAVRLAFKGLLGAVAVAAAGVLGFEVAPETVLGLLG